jgi:hypothetical protein
VTPVEGANRKHVFQFAEYHLDSEKILNLRLAEERVNNGQLEKVPTTVGEVYHSLVGKEFEIEGCTGEILHIARDDEEVVFTGSGFTCSMLCELLRLHQKGAFPVYDRWFWFDTEVDQNWGESETRFHRFFVVHYDIAPPYSGRIICDRAVFEDSAHSGFDPTVFSPHVYDDPFDEARDKFWYRKFYTETQMGQLMVLRKDEPTLYGYERKTGTELVVARLKKVQALLWVLVAIGCLILIRLWK